MKPTRLNPTALLALAIAIVAVAATPGLGQGPDAPAKPKPANPLNPLNPLTMIDPFVGTFDGEGMTIVIRKEAQGYVGEVRRAELTLPLKAVTKGDMLAGTFEHEGEKFEFFLLITSEGVSFNTPLKLKRREGTSAAPMKPVEVATPVNPPVTPSTQTPPVTPAQTPTLTLPLTPTLKDPALVKPPTTTPPATGTTPKVEPFNFKADEGFGWTGLPKGTFVKYEDTSTEHGALPQTSHSLLWYSGLEGGDEMVRPYLFTGEKWRSTGKPIVWLSRASQLEQAGYKPGAKSTGNMRVDGADLACDITEYSREIQRDGRAVTRRLQLWTSPRVTLPAQVVTLESETILLPGNMTRVVTLGDEWQSKGEFKLVSLKHPQRIGAVELKVATFEGFDKVTAPTSVHETITKRHVSSQVPGGIAFLSMYKRNHLNQVQTSSATAVHYGIAQTEAQLPVP